MQLSPLEGEPNSRPSSAQEHSVAPRCPLSQAPHSASRPPQVLVPALQLCLPPLPHLPGKLGRSQPLNVLRPFPPVCWLRLILSLSPSYVLCHLGLCKVTFPGLCPFWFPSPRCSVVCVESFLEWPCAPGELHSSRVWTLWPGPPRRPRWLDSSLGPSCNVVPQGLGFCPACGLLMGTTWRHWRGGWSQMSPPPSAWFRDSTPDTGCLAHSTLWIAAGSAPWWPAGGCSVWMVG